MTPRCPPLEAKTAAEKPEKVIPFWRCFTYRADLVVHHRQVLHRRRVVVLPLLAPAYFGPVRLFVQISGMGIALIFTLYAIVTVPRSSAATCPNSFRRPQGHEPLCRTCAGDVDLRPCRCPRSSRRGRNLLGMVARDHHRSGRCRTPGLVGQPLSTIGDMYFKSAIATITGIGGMAGGVDRS